MCAHRSPVLLLLALVLAGACNRPLPENRESRELVRELLSKLDSTQVYAARKEARIQALTAQLPGQGVQERFNLPFEIAHEYSTYIVDSSLTWLDRAQTVARELGQDSLTTRVVIQRAHLLSVAGLYVEAQETLESISRKTLTRTLLVPYYAAWALLYHNLYGGTFEPRDFQEKYRSLYNVYRDSLLTVADPLSVQYLSNWEKKEARAGNFDRARAYNALRESLIEDHRSQAYATLLYDRFMIAFFYERKPTEQAVRDMLESAIIEVENCNRNIASLLRAEAYLVSINEVEAAKRVSDYYFASLREYGSRKRLMDGVDLTVRINNRNSQLLHQRLNELLGAIAVIAVLLLALVYLVLRINSSRVKITRLKDNLSRSDRIAKNYVGAVFQLYSSYINRLDVFRTKVHASLRRGHVQQALESTSPSGDIAAEERRELFQNFDSAFLNIFPGFIPAVNACLKPEEQIVPKKTELLTTELRILALIKLDIQDSAKIAEMLHCSIKTVYNLRSTLKARLAIPEEEFNRIIAEL